MRLVFMGTPHFAVVSLSRLLDASFDIKAVVTVPDKPAGRGLQVQISPVKEYAGQKGLTVLQPEDLRNTTFISALQALQPELLVVVAFRILPQEVFTLPPRGAVNLHASILPKYRGAAPINWAIINGETETGVTTIFIRQAVDSGNIIESLKVEIGEDMTAGDLHDILAEKGAELLVRTIHAIEQGRVKSYVQNEAMASKAPKLRHEDGLINFRQPVQKVHNLIRGLSPYPAAYTFWQNKILRLFSSRVNDLQRKTGTAGEIIAIPDRGRLIIQCDPGWLEVREVQLEGKRRLKVDEFLNGYPLRAGESLQSPDP
jgi:methionyl-tRNA formyltransferase